MDRLVAGKDLAVRLLDAVFKEVIGTRPFFLYEKDTFAGNEK